MLIAILNSSCYFQPQPTNITLYFIHYEHRFPPYLLTYIRVFGTTPVYIANPTSHNRLNIITSSNTESTIRFLSESVESHAQTVLIQKIITTRFFLSRHLRITSDFCISFEGSISRSV